jgi:hypothetical protein
LGKNNFLRRFVSNFAELARHITTMLRKGNEVKWIAESINYFNQIKKALNEAHVLISPDYSKDFMIFSFALFDRVAVVLLQNNVEGLEQPIAFFSRALRDAEIQYNIMEKQAHTLVKSLKAFRIYVMHSNIISHVLSTYMKDILIQPDIDGQRSKWIAKILEFDMEIKPTKLVKGQGLVKLLVESNFKSLGVNFINTSSENQQAEFSNKSSRGSPLLAECTWYKYIIYFLQELRPPDGMGKSKTKYLNIKVVKYRLIDKVLYWKDSLGVLLRCLDPQEGQKIMIDFHDSICRGHHFWTTTTYNILRVGYLWPTLFTDVCAKIRACVKCQKFSGK